MANKKDEDFADFFTVGFRLISQQNPIGIIYLLLAIVFSGTEASKILLRSNFAKGTVGIRQIVTFSLLLGGWAYLCYSQKPDGLSTQNAIGQEFYDDVMTFNIAIIFYSALSILILIKGTFDWNEAENVGRGSFLGKSTLLGFLRESNWSELRIKNVAEPVFILAISAPLSLINIYLGAPLLFLGVSVAIYNLFEIKEAIENSPLKATPGGKIKGEDDQNQQFPQ